MKKTTEIRTALLATIEGLGLFEEVAGHAQADLSEALEKLRRHQTSLCVVAPGDDEWDYVTTPDGTPVRAECRNRFEILITASDLGHAHGDTLPAALDLKDALAEALLWHDLGIAAPLCLAFPLTAEPMILELDERRGREAWRLTLEVRQAHFGL